MLAQHRWDEDPAKLRKLVQGVEKLWSISRVLVEGMDESAVSASQERFPVSESPCLEGRVVGADRDAVVGDVEFDLAEVDVDL